MRRSSIPSLVSSVDYRTRWVAGAVVVTSCFAVGALCAACGHDPCASENNTSGFQTAQLSVVVVEQVSGAPVCNASVVETSGPLAQGGPNFRMGQAEDGSCIYTNAGSTGAYDVSVLAMGFLPQSFALNVAGGSCGSPLAPPIVTIRLSLTCPTPVLHDDGIGRRWADCVPAHTYSEAEATAACSYYPLAFTCADPLRCSPGDAGPELAACSDRTDAGGQACGCWAFDGPAAGHVRVSDAGCFCPRETDPSWY